MISRFIAELVEQFMHRMYSLVVRWLDRESIKDAIKKADTEEKKREVARSLSRPKS